MLKLFQNRQALQKMKLINYERQEKILKIKKIAMSKINQNAKQTFAKLTKLRCIYEGLFRV